MFSDSEEMKMLCVDSKCKLTDENTLNCNEIASQLAPEPPELDPQYDEYLKNIRSSFLPHKQIGGTCYAYATAAAIHMSLRRIIGLEYGYLPFEWIKDSIIQCYGECGEPRNILKRYCNRLRPLKFSCCLHEDVVRDFISIGPSVMSFSLTNMEWKQFSFFFETNPTGVLQNDTIIRCKNIDRKYDGHTVVIVGVEPDGSLKILNSWGSSFADNGFFRIQSVKALEDVSLYKIYWNSWDLTTQEQQAYQNAISNKIRLVSCCESLGSTTMIKCIQCDQNAVQCHTNGLCFYCDVGSKLSLSYHCQMCGCNSNMEYPLFMFQLNEKSYSKVMWSCCSPICQGESRCWKLNEDEIHKLPPHYIPLSWDMDVAYWSGKDVAPICCHQS